MFLSLSRFLNHLAPLNFKTLLKQPLDVSNWNRKVHVSLDFGRTVVVRTDTAHDATTVYVWNFFCAFKWAPSDTASVTVPKSRHGCRVMENVSRYIFEADLVSVKSQNGSFFSIGKVAVRRHVVLYCFRDNWVCFFCLSGVLFNIYIYPCTKFSVIWMSMAQGGLFLVKKALEFPAKNGWL